MYELTIQSRIDPKVDIATTHARLLDHWSRVPQPWTLLCRPPAPAIQPDDLAVDMDVSSFVKVPISGQLTYQIRSPDCSADDGLTLQFKPNEDHYQQLVDTAIPALLEGFGAYLLSLRDSRFTRLDIDRAKANYRDPNRTPIRILAPSFRNEVWRVGPIAFFDKELCERAFGIAPAQAVERLKGIAEECRLISGGIYIIGTRKILDLEEADHLCETLRKALTKKPWYQFW